MIKQYGLLLCMLCMFSNAWACDICGGSAVGQTYGLLPNGSSHFAGIRLHSRAFSTTHVPLNEQFRSRTISDDRFTTAEAWARFSLGDRWQVYAVVPYHYLTMSEEGDTRYKQGVGDVSLNVGYEIINSYEAPTGPFTHYLLVTGGINMPTGSFDASVNWNEVNPGFQTGSGSWDVLANVNYSIQRYNAGLQTDLFYRYNTPNTYGYQFGQSLGVQSRLFYKQSVSKQVTIVPQAGIRVDASAQDYNVNHYNTLSGGEMISWQAGADVYYQQFMIGYVYQRPINQQWADGLVDMHDYHTFNITYLF